jgi:hypothetical protein
LFFVGVSGFSTGVLADVFTLESSEEVDRLMRDMKLALPLSHREKRWNEMKWEWKWRHKEKRRNEMRRETGRERCRDKRWDGREGEGGYEK